ncbi:hypothetical protein BC830DRAFT_324100 [Chytriomyces sp. MP71]|nr:hypothetical protein BC830DRAFT_324100 [Chytriomyces sp. MP71]
MPFPRLFASSLSSGNEMFAVAALRSETASSRGIWIGALDLHRVTAYAEGIVSAKGAAVDLKGGKAGDEKKKPVASETPPQESKKVSPDTAEKGKDVETPVSGNPDGGKDATKPIQKPVAGEVNGGTDATKPIKMPESEDKSKQPIKKPVTVNDSKGSIPPPIKKPAETIDKKLPETGGEGVVSEGGTVPIKKPFSDEDKDLPPNKPPQDDDEEDMVAAPSFEEPLNDDDGVGFKPSGQAMGDSSVYHEESSEEYKHVKTSVEDASFNGSGFLVVSRSLLMLIF